MSGNVTSPSEINTATGAIIALNGDLRSLPLTLQGNNSIYDYSFSTQVELIPGSNSVTVAATNISGQSGNDTVTVNANIQSYAIKAELTWDTNDTDLDSHLIAPCYAMGDIFGDCYFGNRNPDWGGNSTSDPSLDQDITTGYGPEYIVLVDPPFSGIYQYKVHYWSSHGHGPSTATVKIWINNDLVFQGNKTMSDGDIWDCACISWPSGAVTAGPCSTHTLTVTSQGCCPILVEGLPCGDQTVPAASTRIFYGITENGNVTLTAQSGDSCQFGNWTVDDVLQEGHQITVTMDSDHAATATCTPLYTLTVTNDGCWAVYVTGLPGQGQEAEWVDQNATREFPGLPKDTQVTLTPSQGDGILFTGWYVDAEGTPRLDNPLIITLDADHEVRAVCVRVHTLSVSSNGCCPILVEGLSGGNQTVPAGEGSTLTGIRENTEITLTAQTSDSCQFDYWTVDEGNSTTENPITVTMDGYHSATATCIPLHTLSVTSNGCCPITVELPEGNQTVEAGANGTFTNIAQGTVVTLEAIEEGTCQFDYWTIDNEIYEYNPIPVTMNGNHTAICWSHDSTYNLLVVPQYGHIIVSWPGIPGGPQECSVNESYGFDVPAGTIVTIEAEPENDYYFYYWLINGEIVYGNPGNLTMDRSYSVRDVRRTQPPSTLSVTSDGCCPITVNGLPDIDGAVQVPAGGNSTFLCDPSSTVTLNAQGGDFCSFDYWMIDGEVADSGNIIEVPMDTDHTATVVCSIIPADTGTEVTSSTNPSVYGQSITFTATVTPGLATGTVTYNDGATTLGNATLINGTATYSTSSLSVGSHTITAVYDGDSNFNTSTSPTLTQTVDDAVLNEANGHYYELVDESRSWVGARDAAALREFAGIQGHLATVTSAEENLWLTSTFGEGSLHLHWIGGFQPPGSPEPDGGWTWITGEPWGFSNWQTPGEPNNSGGNENSILFDHGVLAGTGKAWNDVAGTTISDGYLVEYDNDWYVNPGGSIQAAINAAATAGGGTVHVAAGTYYELISLRSGVAVQGAGAADTTIDGSGDGTVVTASGVDSTARLEDFTISNGSSAYGGGMRNDYSSPTVINCVFSNNSASMGGGGMCNNYSSPTVSNCTFSSNSSSEGCGGGMYNIHGSSPTVTNCIFSGNSAFEGGGMCNDSSSPTVANCTFSGNSAGGSGGGMYNGSSSSPIVTNCIFSDNSASGGGGMYNLLNSSPTVTTCTFSGNSATEGAGILCSSSSSPTIANCIINSNSASWSGGGIECDNSSSPTISNCTISDNSSNYGGGMQCNESSPVVINCFISDNTSNNGGGGINNDDASSTFINCTITGNTGPGGGLHSGDTSSSVTAVNCIIWGNTWDNTPREVSVNPTCYLYITYSDIRGGYDGEGNINDDPSLTSESDFHLQAGSPCIDTGSNSAVPSWITTDLDGNPRIVDGDGNGTATVDMGAYEADPPPIEQTYTAVNDFSTENGNPNGVWSYGWMPTDFSSFNLYTNHNSFQWYGWGSDNSPCIWINTGGPSYGVPTGWLSLHPGNGWQPSVLRWTAPFAGNVSVTGEFLAGDGGVMEVAVRLDNQPWWNAYDSGIFDLTTNVAYGTTIDFAVYGGYGFGNTPISATISYQN